MPYGFNEDKSKYDLTDDLGDIASLKTRVTALENDFILVEGIVYNVDASNFGVRTIQIEQDYGLTVDNCMIVSVSQELEELNTNVMETWISTSFFNNKDGALANGNKTLPRADLTRTFRQTNPCDLYIYVFNQNNSAQNLRFRVLLKKITPSS